MNKLTKTGVNITMSYFSKSPAQCRNCKTQWITHEEKQIDVNMALQILDDAYNDKYDVAFIMSGDSDIVPAIKAVKRKFPDKKFLAVLPRLQAKKSRAIISATDSIIYLSNGRIKKHKFPKEEGDL